MGCGRTEKGKREREGFGEGVAPRTCGGTGGGLAFDSLGPTQLHNQGPVFQHIHVVSLNCN